MHQYIDCLLVVIGVPKNTHNLSAFKGDSVLFAPTNLTNFTYILCVTSHTAVISERVTPENLIDFKF
jgi:hypothetical protein